MHDKMKKPELSEICQIEKDLICALKTVVSHGIFSKEVETQDLAELVDMVKDMAETKRNCWEAYYYETVCKAMKDAETYDMMDEGDTRGYNRNRYASGRYAPSGTGNRSMGYTMPYPNYPDKKRNPYFLNGDPISEMGMMGYDRRNMDDHNTQYGRAFREYEDAKRHYTESKSLEDKTDMDEKAMEHVDHSVMTLREIWKDADPSIKKEVTSAITALASEFKSV